LPSRPRQPKPQVLLFAHDAAVARAAVRCRSRTTLPSLFVARVVGIGLSPCRCGPFLSASSAPSARPPKSVVGRAPGLVRGSRPCRRRLRIDACCCRSRCRHRRGPAPVPSNSPSPSLSGFEHVELAVGRRRHRRDWLRHRPGAPSSSLSASCASLPSVVSSASERPSPSGVRVLRRRHHHSRGRASGRSLAAIDDAVEVAVLGAVARANRGRCRAPPADVLLAPRVAVRAGSGRRPASVAAPGRTPLPSSVAVVEPIVRRCLRRARSPACRRRRRRSGLASSPFEARPSSSLSRVVGIAVQRHLERVAPGPS